MKFFGSIISTCKDLSLLQSYLIIVLGFFLPLSVSISTMVIAIIVLLWLVERKFKAKFSIMFASPISYAFLAFFSIHVVSLLWTQNFEWGIHIIGKEWRMLLPLIFITIVKKEYIEYYILSFLAAMSLSEICSYLIWFEIIAPFKNATILNPTPFMGHISYNPFLAFSTFILLSFLLFKNNYTSKILKLFSILFFLTMSVNVFITGGRAGQIGFFVMISLALILFFKKNLFKALCFIALTIPLVFALAYTTSPLFKQRVHAAIEDIAIINENPNTSVGLRLTFAKNTFEIIQNNIFLGVGVGDFPDEYEKVNQEKTPDALLTTNPHNMYLLVLAQTGVIGFITLFSIFLIQIRVSLSRKNSLFPLQIALPILFLTIMFSDSYLLGHHTSLLFVYFSSFLYKDFESEKI